MIRVPGSAPECPCKDKYFEKHDYCEECSYKCKTCERYYDNCLKCEEGPREKPKCDCVDGYFDKGVAICGKCNYRCILCKNEKGCELCKPDRLPNS